MIEKNLWTSDGAASKPSLRAARDVHNPSFQRKTRHSRRRRTSSLVVSIFHYALYEIKGPSAIHSG